MKKVFKKMFVVLLVFAILVSFTACSSNAEPEEGTEGAEDTGNMKIGILLPSGLGDNSIADLQYRALMTAKEEVDFDLDYSECTQVTDYQYFLEEYASSGDYDLIIISTFSFIDAMFEVAPQYPDQKFFFWDSSWADMEHVASARFDQAQTTFVAGAFAAMMDVEGIAKVGDESISWEPAEKIGIIAGEESPDTAVPVSGFKAGVKYVNPDIEVMYATAGGWSDQAKCKELALSMYDAGASQVFPYLGAGFFGVVEAAKQADRFVYGFESPSNNDADKTHVIATPANDVDAVLTQILIEFVEDGTFKGGETSMYGYTTGHQWLAYQDGLEVPEDIRMAIEKIAAKVANGEIVVPRTADAVEAFNEVFVD